MAKRSAKPSAVGPVKWTDIKPLGGIKNVPPAMGGQFRGMVPQAYKDAHQAEWDAANHQQRMAMRKAAPRVKPGTSVGRTRKPKRGGTSIKGPGIKPPKSY